MEQELETMAQEALENEAEDVIEEEVHYTVQSLRNVLTGLELCRSEVLPRYFLDKQNYDCIPGLSDYYDKDTIKSPLRARQIAEKRVETAFAEAQRKVDEQIHSTEPNSVYANYRRRVSDKMDRLSEVLYALRNDDNAAVIDEMQKFAGKAAVMEKTREISDSLYIKYYLGKADNYFSKIEYSKDDRSDGESELLMKLLGKAFTQYGYNCYEAITAMESDIDRNVTNFIKAFNDMVQEYILSNVVEPIRQLSVKL